MMPRCQHWQHAFIRRHVAVGRFYIEDKDMPSAEHDEILARITAEPRAGTRFAAVLKRSPDTCQCDGSSPLIDGTKVTSSLTQIGDSVPNADSCRAVNRSAEVPAAWGGAARRRLDLSHVREVSAPLVP